MIISMQLLPLQEEKMECVDQETPFDPSNLTFAPNYSSTQNFSEAARLASTPFNPLSDMALLPQPPVSTIKVSLIICIMPKQYVLS